MIDNIFRDFNSTFVYIYDILVYSEDEETYSKYLDQEFKKWIGTFLKSVLKYIFSATEFDFLGFNNSIEGIRPSGAKLWDLNKFSSFQWFRVIVIVTELTWRDISPKYAICTLYLGQRIVSSTSE